MKLNIQTIFLILASVSGILFAVFVPPNEVPDEGAHFARVYDIAQGNVIPSKEVILPNEFLNILGKYHIGFAITHDVFSINDYIGDFKPYTSKDSYGQSKAQDEEKQLLFGANSVAHYSPVNYMPQTIGLLLGSALNLSARWVFLLGRLFGLAFYIVIAYTILRKSQSFQHSLLVLFAMPMTVYLAASYSADGMLFSLSFLYIHLIIASSDSQTNLTLKEKLLFSGLAILLALTKQISLVLILLLVAIPTSRFGSLKKKSIFIGIQISIAFFCAIAWLFITSSDFSTPNESVMPRLQLLYLLSNPVSIIKIFFSTLVALQDFYFKSFVGYFGWLTTPMFDFVYSLFVIGLVIAVFRDTQDTRNFTIQKVLIFAGVFGLYVAGTMFSMYILWTAYMSEIAQGVQGRYFIPAFPLILYVFASFRLIRIPIMAKTFLTTTVMLIASIVLFLGFQTIYLKYFVLCGEFYYTPTLAGSCGLPQQLQTENPDTTIGRLDMPLTQTFIAECNDLHTVSFLLVPSTGQRTGYLDVLLIDETDGTVILDKKAFVPKVVGRNWKTFYFSPLPDSKGRKYSIQISPEEHPISAATLGAMTISDVYPQGELIGADPSSDLIFSYRCPFGFRQDLKNLLGR
jgi:uncharacterized membrane protein